jgi:hypothetical protein
LTVVQELSEEKIGANLAQRIEGQQQPPALINFLESLSNSKDTRKTYLWNLSTENLEGKGDSIEKKC